MHAYIHTTEWVEDKTPEEIEEQKKKAAENKLEVEQNGCDLTFTYVGKN